MTQNNQPGGDENPIEIGLLQLLAIVALVVFVVFSGGVIYERGRLDCVVEAQP